MEFPVTVRKQSSRESQLLRSISGVVQALPVAAVLACAVALAWPEHGSFVAGIWLPYGIVVLLAALAAVAARAAARPRALSLAGPSALALYGLWAIVSLAWAVVPSLARDEGLMQLLYAAVLATAATTLWTPSARSWALASLIAASAGLGLLTALTLAFGGDPASKYLDGRLAYPISYTNADAAIFVIAFWPGIAYGARRGRPRFLRALAIGAAAAGLTAAILGQSKGSIFGLVVSFVVVLGVTPSRIRLLVQVAIVLLPTAVAFHWLVAPFQTTDAHTVRTAGAAVLVATGVAALLGAVYAAFDDRVQVGEQTRRRAGRAVLVAFLAAVALGIVAFLATESHPGRVFANQWTAFKHSPTHDTSSTHFLTLGSNRYDFWRVSLGELERHPLWGVGARSFQADYLLRGRSPETPARAHSLLMDALGELGIVGLALLVAGLGIPLFLAGRNARLRRAPAIAGLGAATAVIAQACVDWTWTFPAVALPALVALGLAVADEDVRALSPAWTRGIVGLLALVVVLVFTPPWLAYRFTQIGISSHNEQSLSRARTLDPLSTAPLLAEAQIEPLRTALPSIEEAVRREPNSVADQYLLGLAYNASGQNAAAVTTLERALRLDPGNVLLQKTLAAVRRR